jgi:lipopolysaccharide export LptBFGC system permease protein LptF
MISPNTPIQTADNDAAVCKSVPNKINGLYSDLNSCRNTEETSRIQNFVANTYEVKAEFEQQAITYNDLIITGDSLFGSSTNDTQIADIKARNGELKNMKDKLLKDIRSAESQTEQAERDFLDTKAALPETLPQKILHTIEDYTMFVFMLSFVFMAIALIYMYVASQGFSINSIIIGIVVAVVVAFVVGVLLFNFL